MSILSSLISLSLSDSPTLNCTFPSLTKSVCLCFRLRSLSVFPHVQPRRPGQPWGEAVCGDWPHRQPRKRDSQQNIPGRRPRAPHTPGGGRDQHHHICRHQSYQGIWEIHFI